jgi:MSHA pilin protein MshC
MNLNILKNGFTLIELIMVMVLVGILAAYAIPNLNLDGFRSQGFEQQAMAAIRYGQKKAIGTGCDFNVSIAATGCTIQWNNTPGGIGCLATATPVVNTASGLENFCDGSSPNSTTDLTTTIRFNNIGRPTAIARDLSINLGSTTINIEPETGFAYE